MKVTVLRTFKDLKGKAIRKKDDVFEVTKKRFEEINSTKHGTLVKEVKGDEVNEQNN
ncbi:hypothetical protein [Proteiniborus sp.]|uniref:hypothetical protein n=1 Tax=Proteiniborus sp. TaxID=2079015 RepID=UPI00331FBEEE